MISNVSYNSFDKTGFCAKQRRDENGCSKESLSNSNYVAAPERKMNLTLLSFLLEGAVFGIMGFSNWVSKQLFKCKDVYNAEDIKKTAQKMINKNNLDLSIEYINPKNSRVLERKYNLPLGMLENTANSRDAFYLGMRKLAVAPESHPSVILHEIGHAIHHQKSAVWRFIQKNKRHAYHAPLVLLLVNVLFSNNNDKNKKSFIEKHAGLLGFAAILPKIIEEADASRLGIKYLKEQLGKNAKTGPLKKALGLGLATYILSGITVGILSKEAVMCNR